MKLTHIFIFFFIILLSCKKKTGETSAEVINISNQPCISTNNKISIINSIFETDYVLKHMDPRVKQSKTNLKVLKNNFLSEISNFTYRGLKVDLIDSLHITNDTFRLHVSKIDCKETSLNFVLYYPIEGNWYAEGKSKLKNSKIETKIISGGISD